MVGAEWISHNKAHKLKTFIVRFENIEDSINDSGN